ncbi:MAG: 5-formyltetrahydrofolate cyclo-ligase [Clostridia bacterium]|nr:5-formyltetrahydrofolate cyclo-ligase [Clostridia bacterium]
MNDDIRPIKQQIRQRAIALRKEMKRSDKQKLDFKIANKVLGLWKYRESPCILLYCSTLLEVDTRYLIERTWALGKTVALPRCRKDTNDMGFFIVRSWEDLEPGMLSVLEPKEHCLPLPDHTASICIVPGLAFDRAGYRTGYGKGYYDRHLSTYRGTTIGLSYGCCMEEEIPHGRYDRKVDIIVTENDTYFCNN